SADGRLYSVHDLDAISEFNGHVIVRIPIGQSYPVGPVMSAQLMLTNNSSVWDFEDIIWRNDENGNDLTCPPPDSEYQCHKHHAIPEFYSNAGMGWLLSMGQLVPPAANNERGGPHGWLYRAADGSEHDLNGEGDPITTYTSDGSFLRFKRYPADPTQTLDHREIEFPDGAVHEFDANNRLTKIRDRFGHWIKVDYSHSNRWDITHGYTV